MGMIKDQGSEIANGSLGHADKSSLSEAFPGALQHGGDSTKQLDWVSKMNPETGELDPLELIDDNLKVGYVNNVMDGRFSDNADFPLGVDLDYGSSEDTPSSKKPPAIGTDVLEDNTIVDSGLGPTSSTLDINSPTRPGEDIPVTDSGNEDGGAFVGDGSQSPDVTSENIADGGIHGGSGDAERPVPGISNANIASGG